MMRLLILLAGFALPALAYAQGTDFIPLLPSLPGITEVSKANSLAPLLSQIYKICIGLAAVLAVLQIMRAGVMYMGGDSVTEKKDARALIGTSLAGLLLVLSPVIVFSIINPDILNLDIGAKNLQTTAGDGVADFVADSSASTSCDQYNNIGLTRSSASCSSLGSGWGDAPATCCALGQGERCCGAATTPTNEEAGAAPPPPSGGNVPVSSSQPATNQQPGGPFSTQSQAARAALQYANPLSIKDNLEYGGLIYRDASGQYWSGPVIGSAAGVNPTSAPVPSGSQKVGDYHTHGDYSVVDPVTQNAIRTNDPKKDGYNSDSFSKQDLKFIAQDGQGIPGYRGYLGTPSGRFIYFDVQTQVVGQL